MTIHGNGHRTRAFAPIFGHRMGVEVAPGLLIAMTVGRRAVSMATMRRLRTPTPAAALPIGELLGRRGVDLARVHLVICDPDHQHRSLLVPPMTTLERSEVVRREMGREGSGERTSVWRRVGRVKTDGVLKDELLIVSVSREHLQQALDPILAGGVVPRLIITAPLALIAAARALVPSPLDRPTVIVHWGVSRLTMVIVSEGVLRFARVVAPPASTLDPLDWIPVEIDRSIRHYALRSKGERVEHVIVSVAEAEPARRLFTDGMLAERLRLPMTNLNALLAPELPALWDVDSEVADVEMAEGVFTLAYGAALLTPADVPNLLPTSFIVEARSRRVLAGAVAATVLLAVALGFASVAKANQAAALRTRLTQARAAVQARQARVADDARIEAERQRMRQLAHLLTEDPLKHLPVDDALREIARLAPPDLRLEQLTLSIEGSGYAFRLAGRVESPDLADAQHTLSTFYYGLRGSPLFYDVSSQESGSAVVVPATNASTEPTSGAPPALPFALTFKPKSLE